MKSTTIRRIVRKFSDGTFSKEAVNAFVHWSWFRKDMLKDSGALEQVWDESGDIPLAEELVENPYQLISEVAHGSGVWNKTWRRYSKIAAGVAATLVLMFCSYYLGSIRQPEVCLASAEDMKAVFTLPDSSKVWLNSGSKLYLSRNLSGRKREVRLEGEAFFDVAKDASRPFIVNADKMKIRVLGTKFMVSAYSGRPFSACLTEGRISICGNNLTALEMRPGDLLTETGGKWTIEKTEVRFMTAWTGNQMKLDGVSVADIAKCLEHWYNVRISFSDKEKFNHIALSLTVKYEPLEEILGAIEKISGIHYEMTGSDEVRLFLNK